MYDLTITGGTVVDGTGDKPLPGRYRHQGRSGRRSPPPRRRRQRPARARRPRPSMPPAEFVTPGFVDIHTHYDGQVSWDGLLEPSQPARRDHGGQRQLRGRLRPGAARPRAVAHRADGGRRGHPGHGADRGHHVGLGELPASTSMSSKSNRSQSISVLRSPTARFAATRWGSAARATRPPPRTTSRRWRASSRRPSRPVRWASRRPAPKPTAPSTASRYPARTPPRTSCSRSAGRWPRGGQAVFEVAPAGTAGESLDGPMRELDWMIRLAAEIDRPVSFAMVQTQSAPDLWRKQLDLAGAGARRRHPCPPAVRRPPVRHVVRLRRLPRLHPPADVPEAEGRARAARSSATGWPIPRCGPRSWPRPICRRSRFRCSTRLFAMIQHSADSIYAIGDPPDYEPTPDQTVGGDRPAPAARIRWPRCTT